MARYIVERSVPPNMSRNDLDAVGKRSNEVLSEMGGITWVRSWVSEAEGKIYCEYDAPNPEAIREHARRTGIACDKVSLVSMEINPSMFV
jgi:hypothetical protein